MSFAGAGQFNALAVCRQRACCAGAGGDNEVQRTMLEIVNQLDGFDSRGNIKVLMATNRPDTLDPALLRPGRLDRKVGAAASGGRRELDLLSGIPSSTSWAQCCCC